MSTIQINDQLLIEKLHTVAERLDQPIKLGHAIANSLLTTVEDNFDNEGL